MKARFTFICLLGVTVACAGPRQQTQQTQPSPQAQETRTAQTPEPKQSGSDFEISVAAIERVKQWQPKSGGVMGIRITKGASLKMIGGSLSGFQALSGFELAVVRLNVKRLVDNAEVPLETVSVEDKKGQKYYSLINEPNALGQNANEEREFAFAVPKGTALKKFHLTEGLSVELK